MIVRVGDIVAVQQGDETWINANVLAVSMADGVKVEYFSTGRVEVVTDINRLSDIIDEDNPNY